MKLGTVIFYKRIPTFLSWVQRKVLKTQYSHCSVMAGFLLDKPMEFEASIKVSFHSYGDSPNYRDYYEPDVPYAVVYRILKNIRDEYEGKTYGFISWFTIFIRRIFEITLPKKYKDKVKGWNILWGWGVICSELLWYYFDELSLEMGWHKFHYELHKFNPSTFTPPDLAHLLDLNLIPYKKKNNYL